MKVIIDVDTRAIGRNGLFWCGDNHLASLILIEVVVVSTVAQRVFGSVEGFPNVRSNRYGLVQGGVFRMIGSTEEEQDE